MNGNYTSQINFSVKSTIENFIIFPGETRDMLLLRIYKQQANIERNSVFLLAFGSLFE
jgi:hypothetical protein